MYMKAKPLGSVTLHVDPKSMRSSCPCGFWPVTSFIFLVLFVSYPFVDPGYKMKSFGWGGVDSFHSFKFLSCKSRCRPPGNEALPQGIVTQTSNLQMRPLWGFPEDSEKSTVNLLAMAVGIKQGDLVDSMVKKFLPNNFSVMLFHYDGVVDEWSNFEWNDRVIHVSARGQTKWWFAKRFLHPDIVADYGYIFLWDEDLGVDNFNPQRYVTVIKAEGLEISQPALDPQKSKIHQQITARSSKSLVHRRTFKLGICDQNSTAPPCTGWVEMMAPVFSAEAWRCVWYMIQNDLIHAWGLDYQLGYCAQGDRTKTIGVVDSDYIVHYGRPTLGSINENKTTSSTNGSTPNAENITNVTSMGPSHGHRKEPRYEVRRQSFAEYKIFQSRWIRAVEEDGCWVDPYKSSERM